jgi:hypothetical protein
MATVRKLWPLGWVREIPRETGRYLTRWSVREQRPDAGGGWRMYLHRFWDHDHETHNHPWRWSFSIILTGSYDEEYFDFSAHGPLDAWTTPELEAFQVKRRRVRFFNWIPATRFHRITELHGTVRTLFVAGPLHGKSWGFWVPGRGLVKNKQRKLERGLPTT